MVVHSSPKGIAWVRFLPPLPKKMKFKNHNGFGLISLILSLAIVSILIAVYLNSDESSNPKTTREAGQEGIEQAKINNQKLLEQQTEIQNQINSINP